MPSDEDKKPVIDEPVKSSMEILSELFSSFDAEPPLIIKKEDPDEPIKKHKKSKKKHKHKDKKHKKKDKKRKRDRNSSSSNSEIDLAEILIKEEKEAAEKKIKIEGTNLSYEINVKKEPECSSKPGKAENNGETKDDSVTNSKNKIVIKNLTLSSIYSAGHERKSKNTEDGEIEDNKQDSSESITKKHKKKHKHKSDKPGKTRSRSHSKEKTEKLKEHDLRHKIKEEHKHRENRSQNRDTHKSRERDLSKDDFRKRDDRDKSKERHRDSSREKYNNEYKFRYDKSLEDYKRSRDNSFYKDDGFYKSRMKEYERERDEKWFMRDRYRGYNDRDRRRERSPAENSHIDKKKLLEIARRNAIQMMKSGNLPGALTLGPQAQEKVIAAIKAGGKTVEELTDFCKTLSRKEESGELSSLSGNENDSDSDADKPFHHPFQIKDRPTSITMNIKNSVPLPIKSTHERTSELRMQFPVSSGQQHRKTENEWVPVSPKKTETKPAPAVPAATAAPLAIEAPPDPPVVPAPENAPPGPQVFPTPILEPTVDIGSIVSQRLTAMRRLQENPNDVQALTQMYNSNKEMQSWAQSKQQPGQFTGSTGAQILSQAELSSGYQAWAKKDQLQSAAPVSGGMGMHLLQKMGWKPGEGLGKEKSGALEPLLLEVKLDKKGLVANEEQKRRKQKQQSVQQAVKNMQGKHPVSLLGEYTSKKKIGAPQYILCFECGPDHKKNFLFKVIVNGVEYQPSVASANKKEAKAAAATVCLQQMGLLPTT